MPRDEVADRDIGRFVALLGRPLAHRQADLPQRERDAHDIGREAGQGDAGRERHHERQFGLGGQGRHRGGIRRSQDAGQQLHVIAGDQFLRQTLRDVGVGPGIVAHHVADQRNRLAHERALRAPCRCHDR